MASWQEKSLAIRKHSKFCKPNLRKRLNKSLDSLISLEMALSLLRFILSKRRVRCQRVYSRRGLSCQPCSSKFCSSWVSKMIWFKAMRKETAKVSTWGRCRLTIFKRLSLTKTTLSSQNRGKSKQQLAMEADKKILHLWKAKLKWIGYNTYNMSVSKPNSKRNMTKELTFCIRELRRGKRSRDPIKMPISYWCKITCKTLTTLAPKTPGPSSVLRPQICQVHQ